MRIIVLRPSTGHGEFRNAVLADDPRKCPPKCPSDCDLDASSDAEVFPLPRPPSCRQPLGHGFAAGTYKPDEDAFGNVTKGDRFATFHVRSGLSVLGGFAGVGGAYPDDRGSFVYDDFILFPTTLSGNIGIGAPLAEPVE